MLKMLLVTILVALMSAQAQIPPADPECISDWTLEWYFPISKYCDSRGDYSLWTCEILKWSDFHQTWYVTQKYASTCTYPPPLTATPMPTPPTNPLPPEKQHLMFLPLIIKCTVDPITKMCPVISYFP